MCSSLLSLITHKPFWDRIDTGDEKRVACKCANCRRQQIEKGETSATQTIEGIPPTFGFFYLFRGIRNVSTILKVIFFIKSNDSKRRSTLIRLNRSSLLSRRKVIFHHDSDRPLTVRMALQSLQRFECETIPQPPYSPEVAPFNYHLFRNLKNNLDGKKKKRILLMRL